MAGWFRRGPRIREPSAPPSRHIAHGLRCPVVQPVGTGAVHGDDTVAVVPGRPRVVDPLVGVRTVGGGDDAPGRAVPPLQEKIEIDAVGVQAGRVNTGVGRPITPVVRLVGVACPSSRVPRASFGRPVQGLGPR